MAEVEFEPEGRPEGPVGRLIEGWALLGGGLILVLVLVNAASILGAALLGQSLPGDFEMSEMLAGVGVSCFLPYCQLTGANVTADIFTARAAPRWIARFQALASAVALLFAGILLWRMCFGLLDRLGDNGTTAILQIPIWWGYVPFLVSLALLVAASVITFRGALSRA